MEVIIVPRKYLQLLISAVALFLLIWGGSRFANLVQRRIVGVAPGVTFMGNPVGGMSYKEAEAFLTEVASLWEIAPENATYEVSTGRVNPGRSGLALAIDLTLKQLLAAPAGVNVEPVLMAVAPEVKADFYEAVYQVKTEKPLLSLTINVDWGEEYLPKILAIFKEADIKATFFFTGTFAERFPELVRQVAERGHEVANHGRRHVHPASLSAPKLQELITSNEALLKEVAGRAPSRLFAPPYGEVNKAMVSAAAQIGYRTIMWSIDTIDWQKPSPDVIRTRVMQKVHPGGIVLMHPTAPTAEALPELIRQLKEKQYSLVTVSQLLQAASS